MATRYVTRPKSTSCAGVGFARQGLTVYLATICRCRLFRRTRNAKRNSLRSSLSRDDWPPQSPERGFGSQAFPHVQYAKTDDVGGMAVGAIPVFATHADNPSTQTSFKGW